VDAKRLWKGPEVGYFGYLEVLTGFNLVLCYFRVPDGALVTLIPKQSSMYNIRHVTKYPLITTFLALFPSVL
jgi:hypothetical protein